MITKNKRIGGWDITYNGVSIWIKGTKGEAEQELKNLKEEQGEMLIDAVLTQMQDDIASGDFTAIAELLTFVPKENLIGYLPEKL